MIERPFTDPWDGVRKPLNIPPYRRKGVEPWPPPAKGAPESTVYGPIVDGWQEYYVYGSEGQVQGHGRRKP